MGNARHSAGRLLAAVGVGVAASLAPAAPASAADHPTVVAAMTYVSPVIVALSGETVSVTNLDGVAGIPHNIVSHDVDPTTGRPWFRSPLTTSTDAQNVSGVSSAPPDVYTFTCDAHAFMTGVLVIV